MIELRDIHTHFNRGSQSEVYALRGISLTIEEGEFVVVIGPNGSGKSTLLNAVAGTFIVDRGKILLRGQDVTKWPEHRRAAYVSRVFQDPFTGTAGGLSIAENFALASGRGRRRGLRFAMTSGIGETIAERSRSLGLDLDKRMGTPIGALSGGQRQSLTLLMATWEAPALLLLDEHTSALDPKSAEFVIRLSREIISTRNITTLMVTHSLQEAANLGTRLLLMHGGRIVRDVRGAEKQRLRTKDLVSWFDELRQIDQLDNATADYLRTQYI